MEKIKVCWFGNTHCYEFRRDSVPFVGHNKIRKMCRNMRTTQEIRVNYGFKLDEHFNKVHGRVRYLPNSRDDYWRKYPANWKDSTKKIKQWY